MIQLSIQVVVDLYVGFIRTMNESILEIEICTQAMKIGVHGQILKGL